MIVYETHNDGFGSIARVKSNSLRQRLVFRRRTGSTAARCEIDRNSSGQIPTAQDADVCSAIGFLRRILGGAEAKNAGRILVADGTDALAVGQVGSRGISQIDREV